MVEMGLEEGTSSGEGTGSGKEISFSKSEPLDNGFGYECMNGSGDGSSGASESFRTYKRRRQSSLSSKVKVHDGGKALANQVTLPRTDHCDSLNDKNYCPQRKWRNVNVVLEHMHQLLSGDEGGIQRCIQDALLFHRENGCNVTFKDSEELEAVISNGSFKESKPQTTTEMCQRVFFEVIISEKFTSLCKLLFDNFQGIKLDNLFHLSLMNTKMKDGAYEQSPMLFSSDIQRIWRKLQEIGTEIASLAKSLSNIASSSYGEKFGCSGIAVEEDKYEFCTREPESHVKLEQTEACGACKVCTCRHCGEEADEKDCLVCDSCEVMYHVACINPAVKEIPPRSWYCASCTAKGIGSPHENCVVCERLNVPGNLYEDVAYENHNGNCEVFIDLGENSNCSINQGPQSQQQSKSQHDCKICGSVVQQGEELRSCEHPFCPHKYYHVRCLTMKQLKSYCSLWYCPSCLCRTCLIDKDDDRIVLCDGCDAAYHIYCMKPPQTSIPTGKWFCRECDAGIQRIHRAKRAYQNRENKLKRKGIGGRPGYDNLETSRNQENKEESDKSRGGVDMLLTAASTLHLEEKLNAIQMKT
ncbi:AMP-dependent synthetase and ligase family protein [Hibiscus syriacus]|uniref:AMP-dependent synthetase and ligase family protein n=1 Tax=Hibiscus syriacus TaxID=106335 RepID=A0A6A2WU99_HIBSY|nr:PHD finger protein EHD3-like isoform X1 [Hibiscus syriacus]XP_039050114.1 PHD finger protein EHD3-like isoform X1 [Hibiscus syriacus]KAE8659005.1 AMP-dependent synthetase and ligase family protein [Hibiscus syriacus]